MIIQDLTPFYSKPAYSHGNIDYISYNIGFGGLIGGSINVTKNRDGDIFVGIGPSLGRNYLSPISFSVSEGTFVQGQSPTRRETVDYITGPGGSAGGGPLLGVNVGFGPGQPLAWENGYCSPQIGVTFQYTWKI
jgi:hypothetical protein